MNSLVKNAALGVVLSASCALGQTIPDRPEKLTYPPLAFQVPKAKDAKVLLKNKVPAYLVADPTGVPLVRITVWWRGGAYMEPAGKEGLASLFGSQLAVGGTQKKDAAEVEDRLEALAATLSSSCGNTSGSLYLQVQEKDLAEGLDLLMQALTQPAFAQDRLDLAKRSARQGLERRNDAVTSIAQIQMPVLLFGERFFATENTTAASLDAITREDLLALPRGPPPPGEPRRRRLREVREEGDGRPPEPDGRRRSPQARRPARARRCPRPTSRGRPVSTSATRTRRRRCFSGPSPGCAAPTPTGTPRWS